MDQNNTNAIPSSIQSNITALSNDQSRYVPWSIPVQLNQVQYMIWSVQLHTYILIQSSIQLCSMIKTALYCTPVHNCSKLCRDIQCYTHCTGYPSADIRYPATPDIWFVVKRDIRPAKYPEKSLHLIPKKYPIHWSKMAKSSDQYCSIKQCCGAATYLGSSGNQCLGADSSSNPTGMATAPVPT